MRRTPAEPAILLAMAPMTEMDPTAATTVKTYAAKFPGSMMAAPSHSEWHPN